MNRFWLIDSVFESDSDDAGGRGDAAVAPASTTATPNAPPALPSSCAPVAPSPAASLDAVVDVASEVAVAPEAPSASAPMDVDADVASGSAGVGESGGAVGVAVVDADRSMGLRERPTVASHSSSADVVVVSSSDDDYSSDGDDIINFWICSGEQVGARMMQEISGQAKLFPRVRWHLPPYLTSSIVEWTIRHIDDVLGRGEVIAFKVGYTRWISWRWSNLECGYVHEGYHRMDICGIQGSRAEIRDAETLVIARFRRWGPRGVLVRDAAGLPNGDARCLNRAKGGEGPLSADPPPFFLYIVWQFEDP